MEYTERPLTFTCKGELLVGILAEPKQPSPRGVVIVPGAPQYRTGSHRQFVALARDLASSGFATLRFDYRGTGDSDGEFVGFEGIDEDVQAAIDTIFEALPGLTDVALWGLCDGASAISFYAARQDKRISRLILINPWVRSTASLAQTQLKQHYAQRLLSPSFWADLVKGRIDLFRSARDLLAALSAAAGDRKRGHQGESGDSGLQLDESSTPSNLPRKVGASILRFDGPVLIILSGADLTAQEFKESVLQRAEMKAWLSESRNSLRLLDSANHTYSRQVWRHQVHSWTSDWLSRP